MLRSRFSNHTAILRNLQSSVKDGSNHSLGFDSKIFNLALQSRRQETLRVKVIDEQHHFFYALLPPGRQVEAAPPSNPGQTLSL